MRLKRWLGNRNIYEKYDGETGDGDGSFFGHSLIGLSEMKRSLDFAKSQVKPKDSKIPDPEKAKRLIEKIIKHVIDEIPSKGIFGLFKPKWYKVEFQCGPNSMGGPYLYKNENTSDIDRQTIRLGDEAFDQVLLLAEELHNSELKEYNWDNLEIVAYRNGHFTINRSFHDFENTLPFTSTPEGAIKKKYYHIKWIPLISDYGGNYIGIDLDPDTNGTKGQVIIFGRDEEDMLVLANSWDEFLDWNLELINNEGDKLKTNDHLHDLYKSIKIA